MTQTRDDPGVPDPSLFNEPAYPSGGVKTSGLAIAALVCGVFGLVGCCSLLPSVLGIVFGAASLAAINRGESTGRGLAISGIVLGAIGLLLGIALWILIAMLPEDVVLKGDDVTDDVRQFLTSTDIIEEDETIKLLYVTGLLSPADGCVVLTESRLVQYNSEASTVDTESIALEDIAFIDYTPAANWMESGLFVVGAEPDDVDWLSFYITGSEQGDSIFHRTLTTLVNKARAAVGRPPAETDRFDVLGEDGVEMSDYSDSQDTPDPDSP